MLRKDTLQLVNTLQGSNSRREFSTGNTYPAIGVPRGMTYWTPQTSDGRFTFDSQEDTICGIRATHSPSPWMGDYGHFDIIPVVGPINTLPESRASSFELKDTILTPARGKISFQRYGTEADFSVSSRCALFEMKFPETGEPAIVLQTGDAEGLSLGEVQIVEKEQTCEILGVSYSNHGGCAEGYGCYFVVEIQASATESGVFNDSHLAAGVNQISCARAGAYVRVGDSRKVVVRVATSFISHEQARLNLGQEIGSQTLSQVSSETSDLWSNWFSKIQAVGGSLSAQRCLATAMWRVGLFPMCGHEPDGQGGCLHRSPYDGEIRSGKIYTNNGFWDTHRTVYPLLALIDPTGYGDIVEGFLQAYRHKGWLPKWASPGYRNCMVGTYSDSVLSGAILQGIPGFEYEEAYQAIRRNAFEVSDEPAMYGRLGLELYDRLGYVPADLTPYSVSRTLDFAYSDWCIAQVAQRLGYAEDAEHLMRRSQNYKNLWYAPAKLMRPRDQSGDWTEPWDPLSWGGSYIEGSAWQHSFHVPHDPQGLAELFGGKDSLVEGLDTLLSTEPTYRVGTYAESIHEMREMANAVDQQGKSFGQYAHSNQPVHGFLWYAAALGRPDWTSQQVERVMLGLYTPENLPGDEDNGEMSAWYVLAAMGRFPLCPGSGQMVSAPCNVFEQVTWEQPTSPALRIDPPQPVLPQTKPTSDEPLSSPYKRSPV